MYTVYFYDLFHVTATLTNFWVYGMNEGMDENELMNEQMKTYVQFLFPSSKNKHIQNISVKNWNLPRLIILGSDCR